MLLYTIVLYTNIQFTALHHKKLGVSIGRRHICEYNESNVKFFLTVLLRKHGQIVLNAILEPIAYLTPIIITLQFVRMYKE